MTTQTVKHLFTVDDYERMARAGIFHPEDRVELIEGEIVEISPIGRIHAACVRRLNNLFARRLGEAVLVDVQDPIVIRPRSEPQPDVVLLKPKADCYASGHPEPDDVLLLVEVADTTLENDRNVKIPVYARAGIRESWIADVTGLRLEVFRSPGPEGYADHRTLKPGDRIAPLAFPDCSFDVGEILGTP